MNTMVYADYNASAPLDPKVKSYLEHRLKDGPFGNPNAVHSIGSALQNGLEQCRTICADALGAKPEQILFTSGASEGISAAMYQAFLAYSQRGRKDTLVISAIEHPAVSSAAAFYQAKGMRVEVLPVDAFGIVSMESLDAAIAKYDGQLAMVAIMAANNEIGTIQPFEAIATTCRSREIPFLCDTTQYIGRRSFSFENSGMDYAVLSGHKLGALSGTGILIVREPHAFAPHIFGGGQEYGLRGGTQHYIGIETLAVILESLNDVDLLAVQTSRDHVVFEASLLETFPNAQIIGSGAPRLPNTTMVSFPGLFSQALQIELESEGVFVTTAAACSEHSNDYSKTLRAMGLSDDMSRGGIRISVSLKSDERNYSDILRALKIAEGRVGRIRSF